MIKFHPKNTHCKSLVQHCYLLYVLVSNWIYLIVNSTTFFNYNTGTLSFCENPSVQQQGERTSGKVGGSVCNHNLWPFFTPVAVPRGQSKHTVCIGAFVCVCTPQIFCESSLDENSHSNYLEYGDVLESRWTEICSSLLCSPANVDFWQRHICCCLISVVHMLVIAHLERLRDGSSATDTISFWVMRH